MKIAITGFTGYLGSKLASYFLEKGNAVVGIKRNSSNLYRVEKIISSCQVYDTSEIDKIFDEHSDIDCVINAATVYGRKGETFEDILSANYYFPAGLLEKAAERGLPLFVNIGTALPRMTSKYALAKNHFSECGQFFANESDISFCNVLLEQYYGPNEDESKFISFLINKFLRNEELRLTAGEQTRDLIYIDDVCSAIDVIIRFGIANPGYYDIPLGAGVELSIRETVNLVKSLVASQSDIKFGAVPYRKNEVMHSVADLSFLKKLGWKPTVHLQTGLSTVIDFERRKLK